VDTAILIERAGFDLMSESDNRVHRLVPERPDGTDPPNARPDVPGTPQATLEPAVTAVPAGKDLWIVTVAVLSPLAFVRSRRF
jgi:hypothetical protein